VIGEILHIDVLDQTSNGKNYAIPETSPFSPTSQLLERCQKFGPMD
jgi:hypothetical protein